MSKPVKIYYKVHNQQNQFEKSDWDRSHMASFYASNCDIYTSGNAYDPDSSNIAGKSNGSLFTYIDPVTCVVPTPFKSNIGLLTTFSCSYAVLDFNDVVGDASLVTKVGVTPDTTLEMIAHGFIPETVPVPVLPGGGSAGLHFIHFQLNSGQDFVYGHYEQLGVDASNQRFNILEAIAALRNYAAGVDAPFIFIVNAAVSPALIKDQLRVLYPTFGIYPSNRAITQCQQIDSTTLAIQNRNIIVTNGIDIDMNIIPVQTPAAYAFDEQNAIIITLKNLKIGLGSTANSSTVKNFNLQPQSVVLQEF